MFKVIIKKRAENQIENITNWYFQNQKGIELKFLNEFDQIIEMLSINPFFETKIHDIKGIPLKKFPYIVFFRINELENTVRIISVIHTSRNPENSYPKL